MKRVKNRKINNEKIALRVSIISIMVNIVLSFFKLVAGLFGKSSAMISDSIHSFSDVFSTIIVIVGIKLAGKKSDKEHPYGHERIECVAAIILAAVLLITGLSIGYTGINTIIYGKAIKEPGIIALIAAILSIIIKECAYWYTRNNAKKINSGALMADAWHHRSDSLSSIGSLIGIIGARMGIGILDPIASIIICIFIIKVAVDIFKDSINKMTDKSCSEDVIEEISKIVIDEEGVLGIDVLKTRLFGNKIYIDLEISADENAPLKNIHEIAHRVHDRIEDSLPLVKHCMIHVNPLDTANKNEL